MSGDHRKIDHLETNETHLKKVNSFCETRGITDPGQATRKKLPNQCMQLIGLKSGILPMLVLGDSKVTCNLLGVGSGSYYNKI